MCGSLAGSPEAWRLRLRRALATARFGYPHGERVTTGEKALAQPMNIHDTLVRRVLPYVEKPGRYVGGELNAVHKLWSEARLRFVLAFPDVYEIGMSHAGLQVLYSILNQRSDLVAERTYSPWPDMAGLMRQVGVPLYTLDSFQPVRDADVLGISLQTELCYTNVLDLLALAGIPIRAGERGPDDPIVLGGGPVALYPEPVAPFFDVFLLGDGEDVVLEFADALIAAKAQHGGRSEVLAAVAERVPAAYVPSLYHVEYHADGRVAEIAPVRPASRLPVPAAQVEDFDKALCPTEPLVPNVETVHDRIGLEILRGCTQGCRFCQAGMVKRPARARQPDTLLAAASEAYRHTGHDEVSLTSLSSSDYPDLAGLIVRLQEQLGPHNVSVALPSLRVSDQLTTLPELLKNVRKSSLTVAPEAATDRLRAIINKNITEADLLRGVSEAFRQGWRLVKLYFMIGLPTETEEDQDAIVDLAEQVADLRKPFGGRGQVNVSVSPFVPKPHTPFQWEPMVGLERLREIEQRLRGRLRYRSVKLKFHRAERSFLEGVFSRGDRRLAAAVETAWRAGCVFDQWDDHFDFARWMAAFEQTGIDPAFYVQRERGAAEVLPWDHLDAHVKRDFLLEERHKAHSGIRTLDCRVDRCHGCGACSPAMLEQQRRAREAAATESCSCSCSRRAAGDGPGAGAGS